MANASTVKHPADEKKVMLPYGFVQSPILASLALYNSALGSCLEHLSTRHQIHVSVYMDDIIVSSKSNEKLARAMLQIEKAATKSRFDFHPEKTEGPAPIVTAFNIEIAQGDLSITPTRLLQFIGAYRASDSGFQRDGIAGYVNSVNPLQVAELL